MIVAKGYFDGQNYITDNPIKAKKNQRVIITFLDEFIQPEVELKKFVGKINKKDSDLVEQAVLNGRRVDSSEW